MKKAAVIGFPVKHSLSPSLHGYWLEHYAIAGEYSKVEIKPEALASFFSSFSDSGLVGCNITVPHKEKALACMDVLTENARQIGAVNTVIMQEDGTLLGDNTDSYGFIENIKHHVGDWSFDGKDVLLLGAGGAAKALVHGLLCEGVSRIFISNRTRHKAQMLVEQFGERCEVVDWEEKERYVSKIDVLVNSTTLGMEGFPELALDVSSLRPNTIVADIVYKPLMTTLLLNAKDQGCIIVDGLGMLLYQAVPAFEAWFGCRPDVTEKLREEIYSKTHS